MSPGPIRRLACGVLVAVLVTAAAGSAAAPQRARGAPPSRPATPSVRDTAHRPPDPSAVPDSAAKPSFTGRWKLSIARSVFGKVPGGQWTARTDVIEHTGERIRQTLYLVRGAQHDTTIYLYATDGSPTVNKVDGRAIRSIVQWEGNTLHLYSTAKLLVLDTSLDERWRLSPDRRTLTYARHVKWGFGEGDQTLVFERE